MLQIPGKSVSAGPAATRVSEVQFIAFQGQQQIQLRAPRQMFACEACISKVSATDNGAAPGEAACACASLDLQSGGLQLHME
jgi:hypothetical protein